MKKTPAKKSAKPTSRREQMIVLVDGADNYYEFPRSILQRSKVSAKRKKEVQRALECVLEESGYINAPFIPGSIVNKPLASSQALRYAGFYLSSRKPKG
jgi:hypothetical protein